MLCCLPQARVAAALTTAGKRKMGKRIGTHSGSFHCDEALGCWLLRRTQEFAGAEIVRSRDAEVLKDLDVIIDVGGVYDAGSKRFDHHQRGFDEKFGHGVLFLNKLLTFLRLCLVIAGLAVLVCLFRVDYRTKASV